MTSLFLPPKVTRELAEEARVQYRADLLQLLSFDDPVCVRWNRELRKLDPRLRMGRAHGRGGRPGFPVVPGLYHILRDNPAAPPTVQAITGPDDEFVEPDDGLLRRLRESDLQNPAVVLMQEMSRELEEEARKRRERDHREGRQQEIAERYLAATRSQVSMSGDGPWSQNVKGRRGAKAA